MSDIAIRFDGLLFAAVILGGGALFVIIAIIAALQALMSKRVGGRSWTTVRYSLWAIAVHSAAFGALVAYLASNGGAKTGPNWIDWLALPWSCIVVFAVRRRDARR